MAWFKKEKPAEQRSEAIADKNFVMRVSGRTAEYRDWSLENSVKEGYRASTWVYRAVSLITKNAASVPWGVYDENGELVPDHHLSKLLRKPNDSYSAQDSIELITAWLELAGEAFWVKNKVGAETKELWLYSPERMKPVMSREPGKLVERWLFDKKEDPKLVSENVIHFKYLDPANPVRGISPLQAVARAVDCDNEQQDWNKEAMQNRGVLDGFFSFKEVINETQYATYKQKIRAMFSGKKNARGYGVIGNQATYQHIGMSPAEMDFIESRKFNREEIFSVYGVPLPLASTAEALTYNNFQTSLRILWESKLIPLLDDLKDALNTSFADELQPGYRIKYDKTNISALKTDLQSTVESADKMFHWGVPVSELNRRFELGLEQYDGWDKSFTKTTNESAPADGDNDNGQRGVQPYHLIEIRAEDALKYRDKVADEMLAPKLLEVLELQQEAVFEALRKGKDPRDALDDTELQMREALESAVHDLVIDFALNTLVDKRGQPIAMERRDVIEEQLATVVDAMVRDEQLALIEAGHISTGTAQMVMEQVRQGVIDGASITQIQQAIIDVGAFSPDRALRIARTASGAMQSVGQMAAGVTLGATQKIWNTSGFNVRERHVERAGEKVPIEGEFSGGIRYPCDTRADAADRINCRCSLTFE